jgi:quinolinate synthase
MTTSVSVNDQIVAAPASSCDTELAQGPWIFDLVPGYGPGSSENDVIPEPVTRPGQLPAEYQRMSDDELHARIRAAKESLGDKLVILGHYYQRDEVVQYADFVGDSFQLANAALTKPQAETIVFCGVHFMAETADILARPEQHVILPNLAAGCSMADMADVDSVEGAWEQLQAIYADEDNSDGLQAVVPVTNIKSSHAL